MVLEREYTYQLNQVGELWRSWEMCKDQIFDSEKKDAEEA
jgi:hypothetical protein